MYDTLTTLVLENTHTLIAGKTGSGKSVLLNDIILHIITEKYPISNQSRMDEAGMILIDPKRVEFSTYKNCPHTLRHATDESKTIEALEYVIDIMEKRFEVMEKLRHKQWVSKDIYIIFDEFADFSGNKQIALKVDRISRLGRAANIHLIISTQRPSVSDKTLLPSTKANLDGRIALRVADEKDSRMIIGRAGAEQLPRYGECIADFPSREMTIFNVNYHNEARIKACLAAMKR